MRPGFSFAPDTGPRTGPEYKAIVRLTPLPSGGAQRHRADLACGHWVYMFGDPAHAKGVVKCMDCIAARPRPDEA